MKDDQVNIISILNIKSFVVCYGRKPEHAI